MGGVRRAPRRPAGSARLRGGARGARPGRWHETARGPRGEGPGGPAGGRDQGRARNLIGDSEVGSGVSKGSSGRRGRRRVHPDRRGPPPAPGAQTLSRGLGCPAPGPRAPVASRCPSPSDRNGVSPPSTLRVGNPKPHPQGLSSRFVVIATATGAAPLRAPRAGRRVERARLRPFPPPSRPRDQVRERRGGSLPRTGHPPQSGQYTQGRGREPLASSRAPVPVGRPDPRREGRGGRRTQCQPRSKIKILLKFPPYSSEVEGRDTRDTWQSGLGPPPTPACGPPTLPLWYHGPAPRRPWGVGGREFCSSAGLGRRVRGGAPVTSGAPPSDPSQQRVDVPWHQLVSRGSSSFNTLSLWSLDGVGRATGALQKLREVPPVKTLLCRVDPTRSGGSGFGLETTLIYVGSDPCLHSPLTLVGTEWRRGCGSPTYLWSGRCRGRGPPSPQSFLRQTPPLGATVTPPSTDSVGQRRAAGAPSVGGASPRGLRSKTSTFDDVEKAVGALLSASVVDSRPRLRHPLTSPEGVFQILPLPDSTVPGTDPPLRRIDPVVTPPGPSTLPVLLDSRQCIDRLPSRYPCPTHTHTRGSGYKKGSVSLTYEKSFFVGLGSYLRGIGCGGSVDTGRPEVDLDPDT